MQRYANLAGDSGVVAYRLGANSITVKFADGGVYLYTADSAGQENIDTMKSLARRGRGLSSFIVRQVRQRYAEKLAE